jgi:hypothetical protein
MPGQSVTELIGGPCIITYRGATFRSKGDITLDLAIETFNVETSLLGKVDERQREHPIKLHFVPDGEWTSLGILWPYANTFFGDYVTPQRTVFSITANAIYSPSNNLIAGDAVVAQAYGGSIVTGLTAGTTYYVHPISADAFTIHLTYAAGVAGSSPIAITLGTGTTRLVVNNPLTIQTQAGQLITFLNAAVVQMPEIIASTVNTAVGEVTFEAFLADGQDWSGTNSLYTQVSNPWPGDPSFNPANILTGEITAVWGASAPWNLFTTKTGWRINFGMTLTPVEVDNVGVVTRRYSGLDVTARATPLGIQESDLQAALYLQGAGAGRGKSLASVGTDLKLSAVANNFGVRIYSAAMKGGPEIFSNKLDRVGELTWIATRTFNSGVPNPLFYVGAQAVS